MKKFWLEKDQCTGCGLCENVCPANAISMIADSTGFKYPLINSNCVDCNLCEKACCQRSNDLLERYETPKIFASWSKDYCTRYNSTSGGLFSEFARAILVENGYLAGAQYNKKNLVEHILVNNEQGLSRIRQSKYIQSDSLDIYKKVKQKLNDGVKVIYCGAPCQVAALYTYLGKDYDNLLTLDFICRGMNSPKAYQAWLNEIEENKNSKVTKVWFKSKINGWKSSPYCTRVDFLDGSYTVYDGDENLFMRGYLGPNLYIRPSCGKCEFKGIPLREI